MIETSDIRFTERCAKKVVEAFVLNNQCEALETLIDAKKEDEASYNSLMKFSDRYMASYTQMRELAEEEKTKDKELEKAKKKDVDTLTKESEQIKSRANEIEESIKGN